MEYNIGRCSNLFKVVGDKTRLKILFSLIDESKCTCPESCKCETCQMHHCMVEKTVSEIIGETKCSQSLVSHQLKVLKDNRLVSNRKEGTRVIYSLNDVHILLLLHVVNEHVKEK